MADRLKVKANAKINTGLDIVGKRPDGYHDIRTLMHTVSLGDEIIFEKSPFTEVISDLGIDQKDDITYRAIEAVRSFTETEGSLRAVVRKHVPTGAGLGGGSADGAAAIRAFDMIYGLGLSFEEMEKIALTVGSDLPFLIRGGSALCEGRGEVMTHLPSCGGICLIVKSDISIGTKAAYDFMDSVGTPAVNDFGLIRESLEAGTAFCSGNAFELYMDHVSPDRPDVKSMLLGTGAYAAGLSGSGACYWAMYSNEKTAEKASEELAGDFSFISTARLTDCSFEIIQEN